MELESKRSASTPTPATPPSASTSISASASTSSTSPSTSPAPIPSIALPPDVPSLLSTRNVPYVVKLLRDTLTVSYVGKGNHALDVGSVRADRMIPDTPEQAIYYYEVTIVDCGHRGKIAIGLAPEEFVLSKQTGLEPGSYGYRGDDGRLFNGTSRSIPYGPPFTTGDVIGCGVNYYTSTLFYTKNGRHLGAAASLTSAALYPTISLHSPGEMVRVNFGATPFMYDVASLRTDERERIDSMIASTRVDKACILPILQQYFLYQGMEQTYKALNNTITQAQTSTSSHTNSNSNSNSHSNNHHEVKQMNVENGDAKHSHHHTSTSTSTSTSKSSSSSPEAIALSTLQERKVIRELICEGRIAEAIKRINALAPKLLTTPTPTPTPTTTSTSTAPTSTSTSTPTTTISSPSPSSSPPPPPSSDTASSTPSSCPAPSTSIDSAVAATPSAPSSLLFSLQCLEFIELVRTGDTLTAVQYARDVLSPYRSQSQHMETLHQVMGLLAYHDVSASPAYYRLSRAHREEVADQCNQEILASFSCPGPSALEILVRQLLATHQTLRQQAGGLAPPPHIE